MTRDAVALDIVVIVLNGLANGGKAYGTDFLSVLNPIKTDGVKFIHYTSSRLFLPNVVLL